MLLGRQKVYWAILSTDCSVLSSVLPTCTVNGTFIRLTQQIIAQYRWPSRGTFTSDKACLAARRLRKPRYWFFFSPYWLHVQPIGRFVQWPTIIHRLHGRVCILFWRWGPTRAVASSFLRFLDHTQRRTTVRRTPLEERSAHNRQTSMPPAGFEPTVSAGE